jgi:hypothetical protein
MVYETLYFLHDPEYYGTDEWAQVTMEEYVAAERAAGFVNTMGYPHLPATASFGGMIGTRAIRGRTTYRPVEEEEREE